MPAPLSRIDPTRTITLRRAFETAMSRRFAVLRKALVDLVLREDALGLKSEFVRNHSFASTQANINQPEVRDRVRAIQKQIAEEDIIELEDVPHITVRYGLHEEDPEPVKKLIAGSGPVWVRLGRLSLFSSEKQDVLKIDVEYSRLHDLNRRLGLLPNTQTYKDYHPHLTIAYLKPGTGKKYVDKLTGLEGLTNIITSIVFSDKERRHTPIALNSRWKYQTSLQKLAAFRAWLQDQMKAAITSEDAWWEKYVEDGYRKGAKRALQDVMKERPEGLDKKLDWYKGTQREFMQSSFGRVVPVEKVKMLASRIFSDLDGITDFMETRIVRALTDGLTQGQHPNQIAAEMTKTVTIGLQRAKTLSRTEIIRSHAEGQLDALERLGVDRVGVTVEWSTAGDNHVCPMCKPLEGVVLTIKEARGILPRHPNCRCSFKPAGMIDRRGTQIKTKNAIDAAIDRSLGYERKRTKSGMARSGKLSSWVGAKLKVAKNRPQTLIG